ncbi:excinuclease ABC subunit UvrC [Halocola ammonii]
METPENIQSILKRLPKKPGVYQHFDKDGRLLYVGKAKNLKNRVSSYFNKNRYESGRTRLMVRKISDIKYIVVDTELDALLLENSLIKKHQPRYNVMLKDDKTYPWIVIKKERFPRVFSTRNVIKDGSEYYGPYASVKMMNTILGLVRQLYPIRTCKYNLSKENVEAGKFKVCLEYHLGNCLGPCEGKQTEKDHNENIAAIRKIIRGDLSELIRELKSRMAEHSEKYEFEDAQKLKDKLDVLQRFQAKSTIVNPNIHNVDVFSIVSDHKSGYVNYMRINNGTIVQGHTSEIKKKLEETDEEMLEYAIVEMRSRFNSQSSEVYVPFEPQIDLPGVYFHVPQRGDKKKLLELSQRNATYYMRDKHKQQSLVNPEEHQQRIMRTLQEDLRMKDLPVHIECFDNSNIQGTNPASACVVFKQAKPSKKDYRKYNIKTVVGPDDFASMYEVVYRRYKRLRDEEQSFPQLIIIDGGKGQLSASVKALDDLGLRGKMTIIGIAKKLEEIYFPGDKYPLYIDKKSESLKLIQQLRNEAHRFSLKHHRDRRSKAALRSELTDIKGVGFRSAQQLLWKFKTVQNVKTATLEELQQAVNKRIAETVWEHFREAE